MIKQLIAALLLMLPLTLTAEETTVLVITQSNGTVTKFALADTPVITYNGDELNVKSAQQELTTSMADIVTCTFATEQTGTGIERVTTEPQTHFSFSAVQLDGLKAGDRISIYSLNGQQLNSTTADSEGHAQLDLNTLGHGIYILHTPGKSFKIRK